MPTLNTRHRQPLAALIYTCLSATIAAIIVLCLGIIIATSRTLGDILPPAAGPLFFAALSAAAVFLLAYPILHYILFSFELGEHSITIHSGIIFRQHETINFGRIQTIDNERNPILMLLGLSLLEIWTASPDQQPLSGGHAPQPDALVLLKRDMADAMKNHMLNRPAHVGL